MRDRIKRVFLTEVMPDNEVAIRPSQGDLSRFAESYGAISGPRALMRQTFVMRSVCNWF